jgi:hypothetical protein
MRTAVARHTRMTHCWVGWKGSRDVCVCVCVCVCVVLLRQQQGWLWTITVAAGHAPDSRRAAITVSSIASMFSAANTARWHKRSVVGGTDRRGEWSRAARRTQRWHDRRQERDVLLVESTVVDPHITWTPPPPNAHTHHRTHTTVKKKNERERKRKRNNQRYTHRMRLFLVLPSQSSTKTRDLLRHSCPHAQTQTATR